MKTLIASCAIAVLVIADSSRQEKYLRPRRSRRRITIRHLLAIQAAFAMHICFANPRIHSMKPRTTDRIDALVRLVSQQKGVNFEPGAEFQDNNGAYTMLADLENY